MVKAWPSFRGGFPSLLKLDGLRREGRELILEEDAVDQTALISDSPLERFSYSPVELDLSRNIASSLAVV